MASTATATQSAKYATRAQRLNVPRPRADGGPARAQPRPCSRDVMLAICFRPYPCRNRCHPLGFIGDWAECISPRLWQDAAPPHLLQDIAKRGKPYVLHNGSCCSSVSTPDDRGKWLGPARPLVFTAQRFCNARQRSSHSRPQNASSFSTPDAVGAHNGRNRHIEDVVSEQRLPLRPHRGTPVVCRYP